MIYLVKGIITMKCLSSLRTILSRVPDPRQLAKVRHPLPAMMLQACLATAGGSRGPTAIAQWGVLHAELGPVLGYPGTSMASAPTFSRVFRALDWECLVRRIQEWVETRLAQTEKVTGVALALDGKTLRGSKKRGAIDTHVLTAVIHGIGVTLAEWAVDEKTNEIPVAQKLLSTLCLENRVVTGDALLTQKKLTATNR